MKREYLLLLFSMCLGCLCYENQATEPAGDSISQEAKPKKFDFFSADEALEMTISVDIKELMRTKAKPEYIDAALVIKISDNDSISMDIKVKARGFMRRDYCSFPPVMLKLSERKADSAGLKNHGKIKLVTPCMSSTQYQGYVLKEFLTYRLFNKVTPYSLMTRLVKITFEDTRKPDKKQPVMGFLIENENDMAERNGALIIDNPILTQKHMEPSDMTRMTLFNYMIGNTDWAVPTQHNVKILRPLNGITDKGIPVPYDFDYAGFVNAAYAAPAEALPIKSVHERYYLGICENSDELEVAIEEFNNLKDEFLNTIRDFEYLSKSDKKTSEYYINSFYKLYRNQNSMPVLVNRTCMRY